MQTRLILTTFTALSSAILLSGCVIALGNRGNLSGGSAGGTLGQQMLDLQKARNAGALSQEEYQAQKDKVLDSKSK